MESTLDGPPLRVLTYRPALDGLRAIAVLAVFVYHAHEPSLSGGWFGVDIFFVLSGFLITSILLREESRVGRLRLTRFWLARARRLLPALTLVLMAVVAGGAFWTLPSRRSALAGDVLATMAYVANWRFLRSDDAYFGSLAAPSPLRHTWSLAIEEQYYLVFPLLLLLLLGLTRRRRAPMALVFGGLAVLSAWWMSHLFDPHLDPSRVYYGTDTRVFELLAGASVATLLVGGGRSLPRARRLAIDRWCRRLALPALLVVLMTTVWATKWQTALFSWALLPACLVVAVVIVAAFSPHPSRVQRWLSWEPLRRIGVVSYGLYLWHWPVIVYLTPARLPVDNALLVVLVQGGVTGALAVLSYRFIEDPIRRHGLRGLLPNRPRLGTLAAITAVATLATGVVALPRSSFDPGRPGATSARSVVAATFTPTPWQGAPPVKATLVGNSIPLSLATAFPPGAFPGLTVAQSTNVGCDPFDAPKVVNETIVRPTTACLAWREEWPRVLAADPPDVAVVFVSQAAVNPHIVDDRQVDLADDAYRRYLLDSFTQMTRQARHAGAKKVAFVNLACHRFPDFGNSELLRINDDTQVERLNAVLTQWGQSADVPVIDQYSLLCPAGFSSTLNGVPLYADGAHFTAQSGPVFWSWLAPQLRAVAER